MLSKIREKTQGIIATLILSFIAMMFIAWGIGSYFEGGPSTTVAKVNGVEISQQAYRQELERSVDPQRANDPAAKQLALSNLIEGTLLIEEAQKRGYRLSDARLGEMIRKVPYFQSNGRFETAVYESWLRIQGIRQESYEAQARLNIVTGQLQQGLSQSAFVTDADVAVLVRLLKQERRVSYVLVKPDVFLPKVTVSSADVEQYYQANPDNFRTPEAVRVEYVVLSTATAAQQAQPSEEELRQAYDADAARYVTPEKRRVSHILINIPSAAADDAVQAARKRADGLVKQARGGNFATLAKQHSDDKESAAKGGDLGEIRRGLLPPELETAVLALKAGEVTAEPVRTQYGYHIVKLVAHTPEQRRSYESAKAELVQQVRKRKGEERFYEQAERLRNLSYEHPEGLQPAAKDLGLTVQTSGWFTRSGGAGIAAQPRVVTAAFEPEVLRQERNSDVIELDAQSLAAVRVVGHKPSTVRPLEEVRANIEGSLKQQRAREQARAAAEEWAQKLGQGGTLAELARTVGAKVEASKTLTRDQPNGVDRRLLDAAFAAARPKDRPVYGNVDMASQGYAVYALEAVRDVDPATADAATKDKARRLLVQRRGAEQYTSYREGLRREAEITINKEQL